jgi:hypothetical protein
VDGPEDKPHENELLREVYGFVPGLTVSFRYVRDEHGSYAPGIRRMMQIVFALLDALPGDAVFELEGPSRILQRTDGVLSFDHYWLESFREDGIEPPASLTYKVADLADTKEKSTMTATS